MKRAMHGLLFALVLGAQGCEHQLEGPTLEAAPAPIEDGALNYLHADGGDRSLHIVDVDLCAPGIELVATGPQDGTRTVSSFAARTGALVAINGGHSWGGDPGLSAHDGAFFGLPDRGDLGQAVFGDGAARFVHMFDDYAPAPGDEEVLTGLLTLVHDGVAQHDVLPNDSPTCSQQHPRTLLGLTADKRRAILVVVDGRAPSQGRRGMTCGEAADLMHFLGAHWALNLDGGGSSEMVIDGQIVNVPSDGHERPVPTHLAVVQRPGVRGHCPEAPVEPPPPPPPETPATSCGLLPPGGILLPNESVSSCDGRFAFLMQGDGNVVLYETAIGTPLWHTHTNGTAAGALAVLEDGNMILLGPNWSVLWSSNTSGHAGAFFAMQDDGNAVLYTPQGAAVWSSSTCCR